MPLQPGNSGGALLDERGNVVGVVSAKLSAEAALTASGALPENVNDALKSRFILGFLESVPEVAAKIKEPDQRNRGFEDVARAIPARAGSSSRTWTRRGSKLTSMSEESVHAGAARFRASL